MNVHLALDVFHNSPLVHKTERIVFSRIRDACESQ